MNKICTSIEQFQKLKKLGIDITTADMYYSYDYNINEYEDDAQIIPQSEFGQHFSLFPEDIPTWSLSALLELIPPYLGEFKDGIDFGFSKSMNGKWYSAHYIQLDNSGLATFSKTVTGDTAVDATFEMVCWLLENKKL